MYKPYLKEKYTGAGNPFKQTTHLPNLIPGHAVRSISTVLGFADSDFTVSLGFRVFLGFGFWGFGFRVYLGFRFWGFGSIRGLFRV